MSSSCLAAFLFRRQFSRDHGSGNRDGIDFVARSGSHAEAPYGQSLQFNCTVRTI